jgi:ABC-type amino acid transport substrate-binding protein
MSKTRNAVIANLTFVLGQMEELKSNINDTMRYIKQNGEKWEDTESPQPSASEVSEESEETPK